MINHRIGIILFCVKRFFDSLSFFRNKIVNNLYIIQKQILQFYIFTHYYPDNDCFALTKIDGKTP
jgi:hypothetical protein